MSITKIRLAWLLSAVIILMLMFTSVQAQDPQVLELERKLEQRDRVINELLERVEALERRVGLEHRMASTASEPERASMESAATGYPQASESEPGRIVVKAGAAERALERSLTREGALLLPAGVLELEPRFSYARREESAPMLVTSNNQVFAGEAEHRNDNFTAGLALRQGLPWDAQLEIGLPYRWRDVEVVNRTGFAPIGTTRQSASGLGDISVGLAKTLLREGLWLPDLVGRVTWDTDSGDRSDSGVQLGGGFHEIQASLSAIKRQDPIAFFGGLAYVHAIEKNRVRPGASIQANFGSFIALSPETSLRLLLSTTFQKETKFNGTLIDGSDRLAANFVIGGSTLLAPGALLNLSAGIGLTDDADDFSISLSLPIRFNNPLF